MKEEDFELTDEQIKACKSIGRAIEKAKKLNVKIFGKADTLTAYNYKAWDKGVAEEMHNRSSDTIIPSYCIALIADSGADDEEHFTIESGI